MEIIKIQGEITKIKNRKNNRKKFMRKKNFQISEPNKDLED